MRDALSRFWFRLHAFLSHKVLHTDDTPHAIALGAAIAMFITFLPLIGFQTVIAVGLAALVRANKAICVPIVWITNPLTMVPIYRACLTLGRWVASSPQDPERVALGSGLETERSAPVLEVASQLLDMGLEMWIGCAIVGLVLAVPSYLLVWWGVVHYRERHRRRLLLRKAG